MKLIATSIITVMGSYLSITAHIDTAIAEKVHEALQPIQWSINEARAHGDSLHARQAQEIKAIDQRIPEKWRTR
ncbi:MAG TPA: hypothetical protein PL010_12220 [Flavobacteriales bacterium]|nr:hypothetical protein [Flavobacteriales bacterium]HMW96873.1 hypothetical protein [Flavobacteriales bacterium]HNE81753.1 hypothetical protein [Flavobacteriales bacterium]HNI05380.1 hypothetical protein [Flavobacteriales bacterium]HNK39856.1 hypothetical protein [Flavobacteriales bacterium]